MLIHKSLVSGMKTITLINWAILSFYGFMLLWAFLTPAGSGQDAAGRGMAAGLIFLAVIILLVLVGLNLLPYPFTKILTLILSGFPIVGYLLSLVLGPIIADRRQKNYDRELSDRANGAYYFQDPVRQQLAAAIASGNGAQLKLGLQQPVPAINESGTDHTTLLDFATLRAKENPSPEAIQCLDLLMAHGATVETADKLRSPTHFLVIDGNPTLLEWFLKKGANPNATEYPTGKPILFNALYSGNDDGFKAQKVNLLLVHGANPNAIPPQYDERIIITSALIYAADNDLWDICQLLLDKGASPAYKTASGLDVYRVIDYKEKGYTDFGKTPPQALTAVKERLRTVQ
jgi:hypothetical protein